ncbi:RNA polymerase I-specific transcription initiation factor RRN3 isoform X2 [Diorhabda carinulata]|uniref:RNA polymerase I-specific transcription initiation factor RRN3 isoform X2 n=1 Tax=Diorhabda carinulata TaxID=1163345 RepID=UPI0025A2F864|nr:RNA polymerase I-specific transcription initiation factor RRN3 isoform X2 [Diorhabda carinulata]
MSSKGSRRSLSRSNTPSSILKKSKTLKSRLSEIQNTPTKVRFVLPHSEKVKSILEEFSLNGVSREYEQLVIMIRDAELTDSDISALLKEASECISLLNQTLRLFVEALISIEWITKSVAVVSEYQTFIVDLLSAHNYHSKMVIEKLVRLFWPSPVEPDWPDGMPTDEDCGKYLHIHTLFNILLAIVPMCKELFLSSISNQFPYYNRSTHVHEVYVHNLLWILEYQPTLRPEILRLIFSKLIIMDVNAPKEDIEKYLNSEEDIFAMDEDSKSVKTTTTGFTKVNRHELAHTLDICLDKIFNHLISECYDCEGLHWEKTKKLYFDILHIFDDIILPTYNLHHLQFTMFLLGSFKHSISEAFLNYLWKKVCNLNVAPILRQSAVNYIASLVARGNFIPLAMLKGTLQQLAEWIHSYILAQDGLEYVNSDIRAHSVFYSVCQALFYVIAFRHKDFVTSKKNITFLECLNLGKIVTSRLNPLRVCQPAVVQNFAAVTRKYQIAYCYSIIEHNTRNTLPTIYQDEKGSIVMSNNVLDAFFPFDPFILKRSGKKIQPIYKEYEEFFEETSNLVEEKKETTDTDDFLFNDSGSVSKNKSNQFSYGSSPGFKFK